MSHYADCIREKYDVETYEDLHGFFSYKISNEVLHITEVYVSKASAGHGLQYDKIWCDLAKKNKCSKIGVSFALSAKNFERTLMYCLKLDFKIYAANADNIYFRKEV